MEVRDPMTPGQALTSYAESVAILGLDDYRR
jgi:hypothetical protein